MRFTRPLAVLALATALVASAIAQESTTAPTTKPALGGKEKPIRLTSPWNKVQDLSDEQKQQINAIHAETIAKVKELEAAEREQCNAILTEDQRKALEETQEQEKAEKKAAKKKE